MHTQCPYCQTLFRINAEQLKLADGKAHCCRCDKIFNALENLHEPGQDDNWPASRFPETNTPQQTLPLVHPDEPPQSDDLVDLLQQIDSDSMSIPANELDQDTGFNINSALLEDELISRDPFEPAYDLTDLNADSFILDSQTMQPVTPDSTAPARQQTELKPDEQQEGESIAPFAAASEASPDSANYQQTADPQQSESPLPFDLPDNLPPIEPTEQQPLSVDQILMEKKGPGTFAWSTLIILLIVMGLGQLAWYQRDLLMQYPEGRQVFERVCQHIKCELPPRKAPEKIAVVARSITAHPTNPQALQVSLTVQNQAGFLQSWPHLQLSLYTTEEQLAARRTFSPQEYTDNNQLLIPGAPLTIHFDIEDPGEMVTGFKFDFL